MLDRVEKPNNKGFTIIEVMIVLAIAGLILLIVFLAVPALQRNARNTNRKSDISRISSSVSNFVSDNNGSLPLTAADGTTVLKDAGTLGQLSLTAGVLSTAPTSGQLAVYPAPFAAASIPATAADNEAVLLEGAQCSGGSAAASTASRAAVLLYPIEQSGGAFTWSCLTAL
jgi:prepilin-type N-terminal cleavage/methylation domain-containing protein